MVIISVQRAEIGCHLCRSFCISAYQWKSKLL